jgi:hypothetical protein
MASDERERGDHFRLKLVKRTPVRKRESPLNYFLPLYPGSIDMNLKGKNLTGKKESEW